MAAPVVAAAGVSGIGGYGYVSMCFVTLGRESRPRTPAGVAARLVELGCSTISLGDTIGVATAGQVVAVLDRGGSRSTPRPHRAAPTRHLWAGSGERTGRFGGGITEFDSSAGGLGGCPYAKSATGNLAPRTWWMLDGLGIDTGVDLPALRTNQPLAGPRTGPPVAIPVVAAWGG